MTAVELIEKKRDGGSLTANEIRWLIDNYTSGQVTDYQMAAMTMAVFLNGLNAEELAVWTDTMMHSGDVLNFDHIAKSKVDKHSTGGVGDKVSIPLGPMVAACGVAIPMMSGRGLGHTGGTLDKLESIPGFTTGLDPDRFTAILERFGLVLAGQSATLVPADRKLYALRDATGTVPSIPLISSSIMSKKLAEDLDGLVLDVKVGKGAFMKDSSSARLLAETMVGIGSAHGTKTVAYRPWTSRSVARWVTPTRSPNPLPCCEAKGPDDLTEITMVLSAEMLLLGGIDDDHDSARRRLADGRLVRGGAGAVRAGHRGTRREPQRHQRSSLLPSGSHRFEFLAPSSGTVRSLDALAIGRAAMRLGAGRETKEDLVDPGVGITLHAKIEPKSRRVPRWRHWPSTITTALKPHWHCCIAHGKSAKTLKRNP